MKNLEHIVRFEAGYDCIKFECKHGSKKCNPGSGGSHGRHGLSIRFVVKGDAGAVQFLIYTHWLPQYKKADYIGYRDCKWEDETGMPVMPADLGYHSKTPHYDGRSIIDDHCEFCDNQPCYYDGSGLNANDAMYALVNGGDIGLWNFLEGYYYSVFENENYPTPTEYPEPLRNVEKEIK